MKLLPLIRRWGLFYGFVTWLACKRYGHRWQCIGGVYIDSRTDCLDGTILSHGTTKVRCWLLTARGPSKRGS